MRYRILFFLLSNFFCLDTAVILRKWQKIFYSKTGTNWAIMNCTNSFSFWRKCLIQLIWRGKIVQISKEAITTLWIWWINWPIWTLVILKAWVSTRISFKKDLQNFLLKLPKTDQIHLLFGITWCCNSKF